MALLRWTDRCVFRRLVTPNPRVRWRSPNPRGYLEDPQRGGEKHVQIPGTQIPALCTEMTNTALQSYTALHVVVCVE